MKNESQKLEIATRILMNVGFAWICVGGLISAYIGIRQLEMGNAFYGIGSLAVGAAVLFSAWFMRRELSHDR